MVANLTVVLSAIVPLTVIIIIKIRLEIIVFQIIRKKTKFLCKEVTYLGHIISKDGVRVDPKKVECINELKSPDSVLKIQQFLGAANFYRSYINGYSKLA